MSIEITYGLERLTMYLQGGNSIFDLQWNETLTYSDVHLQGEIEDSTYNFEASDPELLFTLFKLYEQEAKRLMETALVLSAFGLNEEEKVYRQEYEKIIKSTQHSPTLEDLAGRPAFQDDYWAQRKNEIRCTMFDAYQDKRMR